jgi:alpha-glucosidase
MANVPRDWRIENYIDVEGKDYYNEVSKRRGKGADMSDVMRELRLKARDNGRLPMQWDKSSNAGFTKGKKPWMRVNGDLGRGMLKARLDWC